MSSNKVTKSIVVGITAPTSVTLIRGQLKYFAEQGFETYLMAPDDERTRAYCENEGCHLLPVKISREISIFSDFATLWAITRLFYKLKPDIVNVGTPKMGFIGTLAAKLAGINLRINTCRGLRYEHEKGLKRWILRRQEWVTGICAHKIICISPSLRDVAVREKLFPEKKCIVINKGSSNGFDLSRFNPSRIDQSKRQVLKESLGLEHKFIFGFVGRLIDHKGISEMYNAFSRIYEKDSNTRLLIVGLFDLKQIADRSLIDRMKSHQGIVMPGRTSDVPMYLSLMDVFLLPSWREGFGNVLVEAAAMGIPVISTTGTGCRDAVSNGYNGILVEPKDDLQLEQAMAVLKNDNSKRASMGYNGIEWAKNFENIIIWEGMKSIYLK